MLKKANAVTSDYIVICFVIFYILFSFIAIRLLYFNYVHGRIIHDFLTSKPRMQLLRVLFLFPFSIEDM